MGAKGLHRVGLFVDTQNLYYSARDYHQRNVNYEQLLHYARQERELAFAAAYVVSRGDSNQGFVSKLNHLGYRVRVRQVLEHRRDDGSTELEGDWDMGIAADIVRALSFIDVVVLASGDGDFVPMLELAQERGCRVEVISIGESSSQALEACADSFYNLSEDPKAFL